MNAPLFTSLWLHVATCSLLAGASLLFVLAGPSAVERASKWESWLVTASKLIALVALASGVVWFALRAATFTGRLETATDPSAVLAAATGTWVGKVWLARQSLLAFALAYLSLAGKAASRADWFASRWFLLALSACALASISLASHPAAIPRQVLATVADVLHLLAAGLWLGALPFLALLMFSASCIGDPAQSAAFQTLRRFSRVAALLIFILGATGLVTATYLLGDIPGLIGTAHGQLLLAKVALLVPVLLIASHLRDKIGGAEKLTYARRIASLISLEAAIVLTILGLAIAMTLSVPGKHTSPTWPFPVRYVFAPDFLKILLRLTLTQSAIVFAAVGVLAGSVTLALRKKPKILTAVAAGLLVGATVAATLIGNFVEATPASYARATVPFNVRAIERGRQIWHEECASCAQSGVEVSTSLTAGDLYWLSFDHLSPTISDEGRWRVAYYLWQRTATAVGLPQNPIRAPDFDINIGPLALGTLADHRKGKSVLLVLYNLPQSQARLDELAKRYAQLAVYNVEIVAVQRKGSANPVAELVTSTPALFPIVTEDNEIIAAAYDLFTPGAAHAEFLIDPYGNVRAVWTGVGHDVDEQVRKLLAEGIDETVDDHLH